MQTRGQVLDLREYAASKSAEELVAGLRAAHAGYLANAEEPEVTAVDRDEERRAAKAALKSYLTAQGFPPKFLAEARWSGVVGCDREIVARLRSMSRAEYRATGILRFWGDVGTGKSYLATLVAGVYRLDGGTCRWVTQGAFRRATDTHEPLSDECRRVGLLVIDDFGAGMHPNLPATADLDDLVRERVGRGLCTVLTTNFSHAELPARVGAPLASVVCATSGLSVQFTGADIRTGGRVALGRER